MNREIIKILENLKEKPTTEKVDRVLLLRKLYSEYSNGFKELESIAHFFLDGFDELPALNEKHLWNKTKYVEVRTLFVRAHHQLVELIDVTLTNIKNNESRSFDSQLSKAEFLDQVKSGKTKFEDIELESIDLRNEMLSGLTFKNCIISADFRNSNLSKSKFIKSNIKTSDFRGADLTYGLMGNVCFESTRFKGAKVDGFVFNDNSCHSVKGIGQDDFEDWIIESE